MEFADVPNLQFYLSTQTLTKLKLILALPSSTRLLKQSTSSTLIINQATPRQLLLLLLLSILLLVLLIGNPWL